ncbi:MAG: hypothetical protein RQ754_08130 [Desulfuromonadales bacterium]|nr:hypothetical protein [Desulfuromonadales bacterium]
MFDLDHAPPTRLEIQNERDRLQGLRRQFLRSGLLSDGLHGMILFALYFSGLLPGSGFLTAVLLGTVIAITLATGSGAKLVESGRLVFVLILMAAAASTGTFTVVYFGERLLGGALAAVATFSIVLTGATLGGRIMQVLAALEALEQIDEDHPAFQELNALCRDHAELGAYRSQARDILRPFLTFGELQAMRTWVTALDR